MKTSSIKKYIALGLTLAGAAFTPSVQAGNELFIEGGSASSTVLFDRATNFFTASGGTLTSATFNSGSTVAQFTGNSLNPTVSGLNPITIDINIANGAVAGLNALITQQTAPGDTNLSGLQIPDLVDSATQPSSVGITGVNLGHLIAQPTYVVPLIYAKNTNSTDTAGITNLTQRQAVALETSTNLPATFFGGTSTNVVYFVGRNSQAAVRTIIDLVIYNSATIASFATNSSGVPTYDAATDPGLSSGGAVANNLLVITNGIGQIAVQNIKKPLAAIPFEGVPYSVTNVINGSYPLWGYENYYTVDTSGSGAYATEGISGPKHLIAAAFYNLVTNASFQSVSNPVFTNNFIPNASLQVSRDADGGQIKPKAGFFGQ